MVRLTTDPAVDTYPTWSPDGGKICFQSYRAGSYDLWVIPATGGTASRLTSWSGHEATPSYSPNGQYIAFTGNFSGLPYDEDIYIMPAAGGNYVNFTNSPGYDAFPDWHPAGNYIVFSSEKRLYQVYPPTPSWEKIYKKPYPTGPATQINTGLNYWEQRPRWSPDGGEVAFAALIFNPSAQQDIFRVPAGGGTAINVTQSNDLYENAPSWSPDRQYIAFEASVAMYGKCDIYIKPLTGGHVLNLTNHPANDYAPAWSPDGSRIAFVSNRDGNDEIYVLYLSGEAVAPASLGKIKALFR